MKPCLTFTAAAFFTIPLLHAAEDLAIGHLTATSYGDWSKTGTAFDSGPATGDLLPKLEITNAGDSPVISSEVIDDAPTGTLTSPDFTVSLPYIAFRIGGGDYERHACLDLLIDGKIVRSATGRNTDRLAPASWDVTAFAGKSARIRVTDEATGDWGHINVARIVQTDHPEQLPVATQPLYHESIRPQFHFTARQWTMDRLEPGQRQEGWINDLNGLIYYDGEYHLFAQRWAKCWLHAVSRDLIHWTELQPAFWEESLGSGVQSGTCVIDYQNTSGLGSLTNPPMIAFWSRFDNRTQCLHYSLDHGRTWTPYAKNPLMLQPERDPKVFWYAPGNHWVMVLYGDGQYHIFTSQNLLDWHDEKNPIPDSFECPDLFELPVDSNPSQKKWVLIQGNGNYSIGSFNGVKFSEESKRFPCDVGPNFYATQSWANVETGDGRRIQTAWMRSPAFPAMAFSQQISFPCQLSLHTTPDGLRIFRQPIKEIEKLHAGETQIAATTLKDGEALPLAATGDLYHLKAELSIPDGAKLTLTLRGVPLTLTAKTLESGHHPAAVQDRIKTLEVLLDRGSIEAFANDGEISSTRFALPKGEGITLKAEGGPVTIKSLALHSLKSAWPDQPTR